MKREELNTVEYIESGILEIYALGMLSEAERAEVEDMAAKYPEVKQALREIEEALGDMALSESVSPPPALKDDILTAAFEAEQTSEGRDEPIVKPLNAQAEKAGTSSNSFSFLAVAATVVLLVSLGVNFWQYQKVETLEKDLEKTEMRVAELESDNQVMVANFKDVQQNLAILA